METRSFTGLKNRQQGTEYTRPDIQASMKHNHMDAFLGAIPKDPEFEELKGLVKRVKPFEKGMFRLTKWSRDIVDYVGLEGTPVVTIRRGEPFFAMVGSLDKVDVL